jgi:hypothetical protein
LNLSRLNPGWCLNIGNAVISIPSDLTILDHPQSQTVATKSVHPNLTEELSSAVNDTDLHLLDTLWNLDRLT